MTIDGMRRVQQQVAVVIGLLGGLAIGDALDLMERAAKQTRIVDPIMWAKTRSAHQRMTNMMRAALTFQRTVGAVREEIADAVKFADESPEPGPSERDADVYAP